MLTTAAVLRRGGQHDCGPCSGMRPPCAAAASRARGPGSVPRPFCGAAASGSWNERGLLAERDFALAARYPSSFPGIVLSRESCRVSCFSSGSLGGERSLQARARPKVI